MSQATLLRSFTQERGKILSKTTAFLLANELLERLAFYGMAANLVIYMTTKMHLTPSSASSQVQLFWGVTYTTPLLGAYLADAVLGRYNTIITFSVVYLLGFVGLSLQALLPMLHPQPGEPASTLHTAMLFCSLYVLSLGSGCIKPCVSTFGADQFNADTDPQERQLMGSYFNKFYIAINIGSFVGCTIVVWLEQQVSWGVGFSLCAASFIMALIMFVAGSKLYRRKPPKGSPFSQVWLVLTAAWAKRHLPLPSQALDLHQSSETGAAALAEAGAAGEEGDAAAPAAEDKLAASGASPSSRKLTWLDHAAIVPDPTAAGGGPGYLPMASLQQVDEVKQMSRLMPVWCTMVVYNMVSAQMNSLFILQGQSMNTQVLGVEVPAASLGSFNTIACIVITLLYDSVIQPAAVRAGRQLSTFQQIGVGYVISACSMMAAAVLEICRMRSVRLHHLEDVDPLVTPPPISVVWQVIPYFLLGSSEVFTNVGSMVLFYEAAPASMRSVSTAMQLISFSCGAYISSGMMLLPGPRDWVGNNLNKGHLDYMFWLLAGLQLLAVCLLVPIGRAFYAASASNAKPEPQPEGLGEVRLTSGLSPTMSMFGSTPASDSAASALYASVCEGLGRGASGLLQRGSLEAAVAAAAGPHKDAHGLDEPLLSGAEREEGAAGEQQLAAQP